MKSILSVKKILSDLVQFDTVSKNSNLELICYIQSYLSGHGVESTVIKDDTGQKANLIARIGPPEGQGVILSGHTDVVPADSEKWLTPPFVLSERDGKLFGRGAADMKGFLACVLAMVPSLTRVVLQQPVYLCFSYDEEVGCLGVKSIAEYFKNLPNKPFLAIIGEPSEMKLVNGQKGKKAMICEVKGTMGHSSMAPKHVNPIEYGSHVIVILEELAEKFKTHGPFDDDFTIPFTTLSTTMMNGGVATNITPESCSISFEIRNIPSHNSQNVIDRIETRVKDEVEAVMLRKNHDVGISWTELFSYPAMGDATSSRGFQYFKEIMPELSGKVSYGTEGGVFEKHGEVPSVIIGPGSIAQAHKADEFVEISQLQTCLDFLERLVQHMQDKSQ